MVGMRLEKPFITEALFSSYKWASKEEK